MKIISTIIIILAAGYFLMLFTWVFYQCIMNLSRMRDKILDQWQTSMFAYPIMFIGAVLNMVFNAIGGTIIFHELPKELAFTARCSRHKKNKGSWQAARADWWCSTYLDDGDPSGDHC